MRVSTATTASGGPFGLAALVIAASVVACGLENITTGGNRDAGTTPTPAATEPTSDAGPALTGTACGPEENSGATLCRATSQCPSVAVDPQGLPHCGFRIKGSSSELVCGCGEALCPMGTFTTCAQAAQLITSQTEAQVCQQLAEGRCAPTTGSSSSSSSGSSGTSGASGTCDKVCLAECGGGAGCASVCGC